MNILFVSGAYPPFLGGRETQTRLVANRLADHGHCVEVATMVCCANVPPPRWLNVIGALTKRSVKRKLGGTAAFAALKRKIGLMREIRGEIQGLITSNCKDHWDGKVKVHSLGPSMPRRIKQRITITTHLLESFCYDAGRVRDSARHMFSSLSVPRLRILMRGKDVVHCVADGHLSRAAEDAARAEGLPFVVTPFVHPGHYGDDAADIQFYKRADLVFALLETSKQKLIEFGLPAEKVRLSGVVPLLPTTTDPEAFREKYNLGKNPIVLFIGRIVEYKGVACLLDAAPRVWQAIPGTHFIFIGPPSAGHPLQARLDQPHDERIIYLGQVSEQEKGDALAACDLFCMPSVAEILPAVYLEAWSYGKAVVGGTAHGLSELIAGSGGGIVVEQNSQLIANKLVDLLRDEKRRHQMGECGRLLVKQRFSAEALCRVLEAAYAEVC